MRDELGLVYTIGGGMTDSADVVPGLFRVYAGTMPEEAERVVVAITEQIRAMHDGAFSDDEVDRARRYLAGAWAFDFQSVEQRADRLLELERWGLEPRRAQVLARADRGHHAPPGPQGGPQHICSPMRSAASSSVPAAAVAAPRKPNALEKLPELSLAESHGPSGKAPPLCRLDPAAGLTVARGVFYDENCRFFLSNRASRLGMRKGGLPPAFRHPDVVLDDHESRYGQMSIPCE